VETAAIGCPAKAKPSGPVTGAGPFAGTPGLIGVHRVRLLSVAILAIMLGSCSKRIAVPLPPPSFQIANSVVYPWFQ